MTTPTPSSAPYALFVRGPEALIFPIAEQLGFDDELAALAVSVFEDGPGMMHVQALYEAQSEAVSALESLTLTSTLESFVSQLADQDWVSLSQKGLPPVDAGRFWVYGSHDKDTVPNNISWPIQIDAGLAFGTGHHGTTKGCLVIFDQLLRAGFDPERILDLGCGAGVLAIAAAKALGRPILATDIDQDAVDVTLENARINEVGEFIQSEAADGFDSPHLAGRQFDLIFANILAGPLMGLAPDIAKALGPGGKVILSGILDEQADRVSNAFTDTGLSIEKQPSVSGWTSLIGSA